MTEREYVIRRDGRSQVVRFDGVRATALSVRTGMAFRVAQAMSNAERLVITLNDGSLLAGVPRHAIHDQIKAPKDAPPEFSTMIYRLDDGSEFALNDVKRIE